MTDESIHAAHLQQLVRFFENLTAGNVHQLRERYAGDAGFKDPFNDVCGVAGIERIFQKMFDDVLQPRFQVTGSVLQGDQAFLTWQFHFRLRNWRRGVDQCINGCSHIRFREDGRIAMHRDYWDAAEELYEKLPIVGILMRWMKRRAQA